MIISNKQFCARLRKAKKLAVREYPSLGCIYYACRDVGIFFGLNSYFDKDGNWQTRSKGWCFEVAKSKRDISAVFDNSIRNLGEEP